MSKQQSKADTTHRFFENQDFSEAWHEYWEWRKKKKFSLADRVWNNQLKKLEQFSGGDVVKATAVIDKALEKGYQTFWPLNENDNYPGSTQSRNRTRL